MAVWQKTASGSAELKSRSLQLDPALRSLLLMIDGQKSEEMLLKHMLGAQIEQFRALAGLSLIERIDGGSPESERVALAGTTAPVRSKSVDRETLTHVISATLGLAGLSISERVRLAQTPDELRSLSEMVVELVRLRHGDSLAARVSERLFGQAGASG